MGDSGLRLSKSQTLAVVTDTAEVLELVSTWAVGGEPPPSHFHPSQDEEFRVVEGVLTVEVDGQGLRECSRDDVIVVPRGVTHRMWNAGEVPARATWRVTPALRTCEMFRTIDSKPGPLGMVAMLIRFRREFRLSRLRSAD